MTDTSDAVLLEQFARNNSEAAFAVLVQRHIALVHSVALRHTASPQHAQDITQAVFIILARKAATLGHKTVLPGWLYTTARLTAANFQRAEMRRIRREQEVFMQSTPEETTNHATWRELAPQLDAAMACLGISERDALVLRYFQNKSIAEVGAFLGLAENTAQKRVSRALEKLRKFLTKHGVSSTTAIIAAAISTNSVQAAPAVLTKAVTATAIAKGATASTSTLILIKGALKIMAWTKAKTAVVTGAVIILAAATTLTAIHHYKTAPPAQRGSLKLPTGNVTPMVAYSYSRCAIILASDGSLWSWGDEYLGWPVLGLKTNIQSVASLHRIGDENDWASVAVGSDGCLAIKSDGTLWGWGGNYSYQLGDGTKITRSTPVPSIPGNDWKQAAFSDGGSFGLKKDGTLWAWGGNAFLRGGDKKPSHTAAQVGTSTNWTKIVANGIQAVGLQADGSLWFWGTMTGNGQDTNYFRDPTRLSPDTNWTDVCFGYFTMFGLKSDGTLWTWGNEANFYTGAPDRSSNATPTQIGSDNDWQSFSSTAGCFYHLLRKKDGSLWALDASEHRIVKPDSQYKPITLRRINWSRDIAAYTAGADNMGIILTPGGEVWTWGRVLGEHSQKDFWGPDHKSLHPDYRNIDTPWLVSNVRSEN